MIASQNPQGTPAGQELNKWWVSTRTVSLSCPAGSTGEGVTISRTARSCYSQEHADQLASELAMCEAKKEIQCVWVETQWATPQCGGTIIKAPVSAQGSSKISADDAHRLAILAAEEAARQACLS